MVKQVFDLNWIFTYHLPKEGDPKKYEDIRNAARDFAKVVIENTPKGADQSDAIRKIREAVMVANASIALDGKLHRIIGDVNSPSPYESKARSK